MVAAFSPKGFSRKAFQAETPVSVAATTSVKVESKGGPLIVHGALSASSAVKTTAHVSVPILKLAILACVAIQTAAQIGSSGVVSITGQAAIRTSARAATQFGKILLNGFSRIIGKASAAASLGAALAGQTAIKVAARLNNPSAVALIARAAAALRGRAASTVRLPLSGRAQSAVTAAGMTSQIASLHGRTLSMVAGFLTRLFLRNRIVSISTAVTQRASLIVKPITGSIVVKPVTGSMQLGVPKMAVRGSIVNFTSTCFDSSGNPVTPDAAVLYLVYVDPDTETKVPVQITMSISGNSVTANWDSSVSDVKPVIWSIRTTGSDAVAQDGVLQITGNEANPAPV